MKKLPSFIAITPTPLLNTPYFSEIFTSTPPLDKNGLLKAIEMVAFPGTKFTLHPSSIELPDQILPVTTREYPSPVFLHRSFVKEVPPETPERMKLLPSKESIFSFLEKAKGTPYVWGGNLKEGIPFLATLYPSILSSKAAASLLLQGLDCSGLLYQATQGYTPRNSSDLLHFGKEIGSFRDPIDLLLTKIAPLDVVVWKGHVILVLTPTITIESLLAAGGVVVYEAKERLLSIKDNAFSIRRFI